VGRDERGHDVAEKGIFVGDEGRFETRLCFFEVLHWSHGDSWMA
jgi:hypothetical protein